MELLKVNTVICLLVALYIGPLYGNPTDLETKLEQLRFDPENDDALNEIDTMPEKKVFVVPFELLKKYKMNKWVEGEQANQGAANVIGKSEMTTAKAVPETASTTSGNEEMETTTTEPIDSDEEMFIQTTSRVRGIVLAMSSFMRSFLSGFRQ